MNTKSLIVCCLAVTMGWSLATAGTVHTSGGANRFTPTGAGLVRSNTGTWHGGNWNGGNGGWGGDWHHHHHDSNDFVFFGSFGFPFFGVGYPLGYPYGYGYYPSAYYPYGAYGYGPSGYYGGGYYGGGYYGGGYYGNGYNPGAGYGANRSGSSVAALQRRLARAGYYRGPIDGIMGPRTRHALRAYQHDRGVASY